jgi:hypothetical protein
VVGVLGGARRTGRHGRSLRLPETGWDARRTEPWSDARSRSPGSLRRVPGDGQSSRGGVWRPTTRS